jgi:hypothetical protein
MYQSYKVASFTGLALVFALTLGISSAFAQGAGSTGATPGQMLTNTTNTSSSVATSTRMKELIEQYRMVLAQKKADRASTTEARKAQNGTRTLGSKMASSSAVCVQEALDVREVAIGTGWTTFNTAMEAALLTRQEALYDAWEIEEPQERAQAIKGAWSTWNTTHKNAFKELRTTRTTAWNAYKTTMKTECKVTVPREESLARDTSGAVAR